MSSLGRFFASRWGPISTGIAVGVLAPILVKLGNPGNMGICVACFSRDIAGGLGLHRAAAVQYIRPEIIGFVLGSLVAALLFREFRPRTGSAPLARFLLGIFAMIGALVFLGCPWRAYLRLGGGVRDLILARDPHLFGGIVAVVVAAFITNLVLGQFKPGFAGQPVAHTDFLWNFGGMVLAGLAFTLAGGCPGRQLMLSGEGDGDAALFALGMIVGAGFAHNFNTAASPAGPGPYSAAAVIVGLAFCIVLGLTMREPAGA